MLAAGDTPPEIRAPSTAGPFRSSDYLESGRPLALFFVKGPDGQGCSTTLREVDAQLEGFEAAGIHVAGLMPSDLDELKRAAEGFRFPLVSVEPGTWGITGRATVLLHPDGRAIRVWESPDAAGHAEQVLADAREII